MELPQPHRISFGGHFESDKDLKTIYERTPVEDICLQIKYSTPPPSDKYASPSLEFTLSEQTSLKITRSSFRLESSTSEEEARASLLRLESLIPGIKFSELTELFVHYKYKLESGLTFERIRAHFGGDRLIKLRYPNGFISIPSNLVVVQTSSNRLTGQAMFDHFMGELAKI